MLLVDVHAHLDHPFFEKDLDEVIDRAKKIGVKAIITNGVNPDSNKRVLELAKKYDIVKAALGMYPIDALQKEAETGEAPWLQKPFTVGDCLAEIKKHKNDIVAIGEVGMDFAMAEDRETQREHFQQVIDLSISINKPLIVHSRKAEAEVIEMLSKSKAKVLMHCFSGSKKLLLEGLKHGFYFSIPVNIVRSGQFQQWVKEAPLSKLLTETDAPYLGMNRDDRNESCNVMHTINKIAEIKKMDPKEVANVIYSNYQKLFG
ncbi:TatD family hydrolase [Candidatus Woesearchaeota archaeon]|nr:TatD family hydrolase [Candidatus Woesearchaeota archaeon]